MPQEQPSASSTLVTAVLGGVVEALTSVAGLSPAQQHDRAEHTVAMIMGMAPTDATQLILAGQIAMLHALTVETAKDLLSGRAGDEKLRTTTVMLNLGRALTKNMELLVRLRDGDSGRAVKPNKAAPSRHAERHPAAKPANAAPAADGPDPETLAATPKSPEAAGNPSPDKSRDGAHRNGTPREAPPIAPSKISAHAPAGPSSLNGIPPDSPHLASLVRAGAAGAKHAFP